MKFGIIDFSQRPGHRLSAAMVADSHEVAFERFIDSREQYAPFKPDTIYGVVQLTLGDNGCKGKELHEMRLLKGRPQKSFRIEEVS